MPTAISQAALLHDPVGLALLGLAILSCMLMAGILAGRLNSLQDIVTLRYDAVGAPTRWGTIAALWELPLLAGMVAAINLVLAWWLSGIDRFASRFMLASAVLISILAWIPLVRFLW